MTDEELADIWHYANEGHTPSELATAYRAHVAALLAEVERRRPREAQMREIVKAVDRIGRDATGQIVTASPYITDCPLCHQRITGPVDIEPRHPPLPKLGHREDCPVVKARALLAVD